MIARSSSVIAADQCAHHLFVCIHVPVKNGWYSVWTMLTYVRSLKNISYELVNGCVLFSAAVVPASIVPHSNINMQEQQLCCVLHGHSSVVAQVMPQQPHASHRDGNVVAHR